MFAQRADMRVGWNVDRHLYGEHRCAGVNRGIGTRCQFGNRDIAGDEEIHQVMHNARLIKTDCIDRIGNAIQHRCPRVGATCEQTNAEIAFQTGKVLFQARDRIPGTVDKQHDGELCAKECHAAFENVAAGIRDAAGEAEDRLGPLSAEGGDGELLSGLALQDGPLRVGRIACSQCIGLVRFGKYSGKGASACTAAHTHRNIPCLFFRSESCMFKGSMVALVTPMHADGSIDYACLASLIDWHVDAGTAAIVAAGTTGEAPTLETREHIEFLSRVVELAAGRIPVIAGTGSNSTAQTLSLTSKAAELGVDACLLVVPYYNKPGQEGLYRHYRTIAEAVAVPIILYNVPGRTVADLLPETVERLATFSNIIGIKEATGDLGRLREIRRRCGADFLLHSGDDATAREFMLEGGDGVISVTANVAPEQMAAMCAAALAGDRTAAEKADAPLAALHKDLFVEANPIPVKWALHAMGRIPSGIRLPLTPLAEANHRIMKNALDSAGIST